MAYYRKYRPQTISELDSAQLRETLTAILSQASVPHAFLLTGPKGLGKTSTARIIAKVVNCENRKKGSVEPCNECEQCISITNGNNVDVLEIDGASNRGIDEIRDLRDKVKLAPSRAKKKVYIIDEVHMLTTEAFNALLKTIEEPPSHVMFLFCTTQPQKVPATILSRCFHVAYTLATEDDLVRSFKRIVQGEKISITDEALHMIAALADGGFRDGTKILEELVMLANGKEITKEFIEEKYKVSSISHLVSNLLEVLHKKDTKESFGVIAQLTNQGIDVKYFISQVLEALHEILLDSQGIKTNTKFSISNFQFSIIDIQILIPLFSQAFQETKYAVIPQLPLELAVVAWCSQNDTSNRHPEPVSGSQKIDSRSEPTKMNKTIGSNNKQTMDTLLKKEKNLKVQQLLQGTPKKEEKPKDTSITQEELSDKEAGEKLMENIIYKVKPINHSVAGVLRGCTIKALGDGSITLGTAFSFHKERLDEGKTKDILEQVMKEITGKNMKVMVELTDKGK